MGLNFLLRILVCVGISGFVSISAQAQGISVSVYEGELEKSNSNSRVLLVSDGDKATKFRLVDLEQSALYETNLPPLWKGEEGKYQGVLLKDIIALAGITEAETIRLVALDGYVIELDKATWQGNCSFVATRYKGQEISIENKGPTRLLLPCLVSLPNYEETTTADWIWNLKEIHAEK